MNLKKRMKTFYRLAAAPVRGETHSERMEDFYREQAESYDATRTKMLHGREQLVELIPIPDQGVWVELGSGTGIGLEFLDNRSDTAKSLQQVHLVDMSPSLMDIAHQRIDRLGLTNVQTHLEDATTFTPPALADVVLFSYSLTMIPNWFAAIDNALSMLKPGGLIAAVDFYVSRTHPVEGRTRHSWHYRTYAPTMFAKNNVHPSPDHIDYLHHHFEPVHFSEHIGSVYGRWLSAAYYQFIGRPR